jgi:hypothetical protein
LHGLSPFTKGHANLKLSVGRKAMSYYNTTEIFNRQQLDEYEAKAQTQEEILLEFFECHPDKKFTRDELHCFVLRDAPVSSITRALANLKNQKRIVRLDEYRDGKYKRRQHLWQYKRRDLKQLDLLQ